MSHEATNLQVQGADSDKPRIIHPRNDREWYQAMVSGYIEEKDFLDLMDRHTEGETDRRTLRRGMSLMGLPEEELRNFARVSFTAAQGMAGWARDMYQQEMAKPTNQRCFTSEELEEGLGMTLKVIGRIVRHRHPISKWNTLGWDDAAGLRWRRQAFHREQEANMNGDHRQLLEVLDDLHQESLDPGTARQYREER